MIAAARHRSSTWTEAAWLIAGIWLLGLIGMGLSVFLGSSEYPLPGYVRALLMAIAGALLSAAVWIAGARRQHSTAGRVAFFGLAVVAATVINVGLDLWTADVVRSMLGYPGAVRRIISDDPIRAFLMSLFVRTNVAVLGPAHAFFGMAAVALSAAVDSRDRDRMLSEAQAAASAAQLNALRYQLNPHFLFNTLNALQSLVETGRSADAGTMIERLSDFLRSTLVESAGGMTTVEDELVTIQDYLAIEAVRFGDRLSVSFDCPAEVRDALVPSFVLQPLVENALKHGVAPALAAVDVDIGAKIDGNELVVWVRNDTDSAASMQETSGVGVGLRNTRERLALLYRGAASLTAQAADGSYLATLRLPLQTGHPA